MDTGARRLAIVDRVAGYPNPFEAYLLVASVAQGVVVAVGHGRSQAAEAALGALGWMHWVWAALMTVGGLVALVGLYWPADPFTAVEIKRIGLIMTGFGASIYAVALWSLGGRGLLAGVSAVALTVACAVRAIQVTRLLKHAEQVVNQHREASA